MKKEYKEAMEAALEAISTMPGFFRSYINCCDAALK
jgi:hypothetical protein